jgi:two-component sensor histidine kinase
LYLRTWFLVTLVLLITGAFIVIYRYRLTNLRKKNIKLERAIAARTHELKLSLSQKDGLLGEKEVLLKEIHHRVKNNLQVISALLYLQGNTMEDGKAKSAIVESTGRVKSISLIHQQLYQAHEMSSVELFHFVKELFVQVELLFNIHWYKIRLNNHLPRTRFDIDTAVPLGLLLNELLTNSFKYAFGDSHEGAITITLEEVNPNHFVLTYTDTGPGLPEEKVNVRGKTLGMRMINQLSKQIGGECIYDKESRIFTVKFMNDAGRKMKD